MSYSQNGAYLSKQLAELEHVYSDRAKLSECDALITALRQLRVSRMRDSYADFAQQQRYQKAVKFVLEDLFGPNDLSYRDKQLQKAKSAMLKILPNDMLATVAKAVQFTVMSIRLDMAIAKQLQLHQVSPNDLNNHHYQQALQLATDYQECLQHTEQVAAIGYEIEIVIRKPFVSTALKMCRKPAQLMGLGELQNYLERGFEAFKTMRGSDFFLNSFVEREKQCLDALFENNKP